MVKQLQQVEGDTYLLRGSPSTLFYEDEQQLYMIDPGHGGKRVKQLRKIARKVNKPVTIILTHYHSDHVEILSRNLDFQYKVVSSILDRPGIEYAEYRIGMTFGVPLESWQEALMFKAPPVKVDETIECGEHIGPLKTVHLPGHTPGQIGILTPDKVFYAADAVFGERVLEKYLVPYHRNPCQALATLEKLRELDYEILVPGHGPVVERSQALDLVNINIEALRDFLDELLDEAAEGKSFQEILETILDGRTARSSGEYILVEQSIRSGLICLAGKGLITLDTSSPIPLWKPSNPGS